MNDKKPLEVLIINSKQDDRQEWLALPTDADKVRALFDRLGIEPTARDQGPKAAYRISAAENLPFPELDNMIGAPSTIDGVNWLAHRLNDLDENELATVRAAVTADNYYRVSDVIELTYNTEFYVLVPEVHNEAELGRYYLNDSGMVDMPENWKPGINCFDFGRHIMEQEQGRFTQQGYLVKSGDKWQQIEDKTHIPEEYKAEFGTPTPAPERSYTIYQLKQGDKNHYRRFQPYDRLAADGEKPEVGNYDKVYSSVMRPGDTLETLYEKFNLDHPADFRGRSLSVSDVVVIEQDGKAAAHYLDSVGFRELDGFLKKPVREAIKEAKQAAKGRQPKPKRHDDPER